MNLGQHLKLNAKKYPDTVALKDAERSLTYPEVNRRVNQLAHGLMGLGLEKGDKVAVLLENSIEIVEVYLATAKCGLVIVPINFRLTGKDVEYIANNSDARAIIVHDEFTSVVDSVREKLDNIDLNNFFTVGHPVNGYQNYEDLVANKPGNEPDIQVASTDPWILIYTSGTTGKPKGVVRSHASHIT